MTGVWVANDLRRNGRRTEEGREGGRAAPVSCWDQSEREGGKKEGGREWQKALKEGGREWQKAYLDGVERAGLNFSC